MFGAPTATGILHPVDQVAPVTPTAAGKMLALWNNSRAMAAKLNQAIPPEPLYFTAEWYEKARGDGRRDFRTSCRRISSVHDRV